MKTTSIFFITIAVCLFLTACNKGGDVSGGDGTEKPGSVTGITIPSVFSIVKGATSLITATVEPTDATNPKVNWTSNNKSVATIDENGLVTGISVGNATILATTEDGNYTAKCALTVESGINVKGIELLNDYFVDTRTPIQLEAKIIPEDATDPKIIWSSDDETIARFDTGGMVTGIKEGTTTIVATTNDGHFSAEATITVNAMGQTSFQSSSVWTIGSQIWSDEVKAQGNPEGKYTWNMVDIYKDQICANGWRVPTKRDFCELDKTLNRRESCDDRDDPESINNYREYFVPSMTIDDYRLWSQDIIDDEQILLDLFGLPEIYEGLEFSWGFHLEPFYFFMVQPEKVYNRVGEMPVRCVKNAA